MEMEYLRRFIAVAHCLNFSEAAESLFISQPTLSHSITTLEKDLGFPLLVRNSKSVRLLPEGERFLAAAIQIMDIYQNAIDDIARSHRSDLSIGYVGSPLDNFLSPYLVEFRRTHPGVNLYFMRFPLQTAISAFENHSIDLCLLTETNAVKIPNAQSMEVAQEKFKLCINANHPLASREKINLRELDGEPFLICDRAVSPNYYDRVMDICKRRGYEPSIFQKTDKISNIYPLCSVGLGVSILSHADTRSYDSYNIKFIDIDDGPDLINPVMLVWTDTLSPLAREFKTLLENDSRRESGA